MTIEEIQLRKTIPVLEGIPEPVELDDESAGGVWAPVVCLPPYGPGMMLGECNNELIIEVSDISRDSLRIFIQGESLSVHQGHVEHTEESREVVLPYPIDIGKAFAFLNGTSLQIRLPRLGSCPSRED